MTSLPEGLTPYRRTPVMTEGSVPAGLLRSHSTKPGVWGLIHVLEGALAYRITDPRRPESKRTLVPAEPPGVVEPTMLHDVAPVGAVRFFVEFHRREDTTDPMDSPGTGGSKDHPADRAIDPSKP